MLLLLKNLYTSQKICTVLEEQEREELSVRDNFACSRMKGTAAVTQRKKR